jgi:hypothetical protein
MKAIVIMAFISAVVLGLVFMLYLISLITKFKFKTINIFNGVLIMFNGLIFVYLEKKNFFLIKFAFE